MTPPCRKISNFGLYKNNIKKITIYKNNVNNGINSINNMDSIQWRNLFNSVWGNMVLFKLIQHYAKLYEKFYEMYEYEQFDDRTDIIKHVHLEYISKISYRGDVMFKIGDLPNNGVLKEINFIGRKITEPINGKIIPRGVEIVNLGYIEKLPILFSTYPSSVHTIKASKRCEVHGYSNSNDFIKNSNQVKLQIKELIFQDDWNNNEIPLQFCAIPYGVIKLSILGYKSIYNLQKDVLPNSIKELEISCGYSENKIKRTLFKSSKYVGYQDCKGFFDFLPTDLETLTLCIRSKCIISPKSNLATTCKSLKKLIIVTDVHSIIKDHTIPKSVTDLIIFGPSYLDITFPNHIKRLTLISNSEFSVSAKLLPSSLEYLETNFIINELQKIPITLNHFKLYFYQNSRRGVETIPKEETFKMLSLLSSSVKTITIPSEFSHKIPKAVTNIIFY